MSRYVRRVPAALLLLALLAPVLVGVWAFGITVALSCGASDHAATFIGVLAFPIYIGLWMLVPVAGRIAGFRDWRSPDEERERA